ncbi:LacI family DNA-binding transcriptional regulator [Enterococcus ureilyticus]|uniref:LacI family DNA-binding transcriptional regulator n=1 Tax=Enterococcus TaxID=1350 RepID=UPI001EF923A7|nr:LacI family DNA-binding transcriptional regulator [Enterococcus ureilyticus]MBM7688501.1 hypothetical protein [Enterococcus ureilyticus]
MLQIFYGNKGLSQVDGTMKVRMKDITKMANVSEAAVSLVLNDKPSRIPEKRSRK